MKLYQAHWTEDGNGCVTNWRNTKADARQEAKKFDGEPKSYTVLTLDKTDANENMRRANGNFDEPIFASSEKIEA